MFGLGFQEILLICVIGLFLFGKGLPSLARSMGKSLAAFRSEVRGVQEEVRDGAR